MVYNKIVSSLKIKERTLRRNIYKIRVDVLFGNLNKIKF